MKNKNFKILLTIIFLIITIFIFKNEVQAKSYTIDKMDIQATIQENGDLHIIQDITYNFNGSYNGIYINVPYNLEDSEYEEVVIENRINDDLYNGNNVVVNKVKLLKNGTEKEFEQVGYAHNGDSGVYTTNRLDGLHQIKVYSPSNSETKTFRIDYILQNVCVKHKDISELYYNFIGGAWEVEIKKLNIDIYLPQNEQEIQIWGHGPYNGNSRIVDNTHANFKVENVKRGQYVAARILFDNSNIPSSRKLSNIDAKELIYDDENAIIENKEEKNAFTLKIIIFAICLLIYWIVLMLVFEKDKKYQVANIEEEKLFEKYNPMMAGCIQGSRTILARDIIAIILGLINKKIIKLEIINRLGDKDNYLYIISKDKQKEGLMDSIEKYVYNWIFKEKEQVSLSDRLKEMPKEKEANIKFKELNDLVEQNLAAKGANQAKVPLIVRGFNIFLFILSIVLIAKHIMFNGLDIYDSEIANLILFDSGVYILPFIPFIMGILYIPINIIIIIRHKINKTVQRVTGQKIVTTTISLIVLFSVIIALTAMFSSSKYIVADEILICIATILILTDNLMLKNNAIMIEDFSKLNTLKYKLENYSIMEDRDIEQVVLWEQYLSYAVSFGIADKIIKRIKGLYIDDDLTSLLDNNMFNELIRDDYYMFYQHASLDRRFLKSYGKATGKAMSFVAKAAVSGGSSSGGGFSGGGGYSGGGGSGRRRRSLLKTK